MSGGRSPTSSSTRRTAASASASSSPLLPSYDRAVVAAVSGLVTTVRRQASPRWYTARRWRRTRCSSGSGPRRAPHDAPVPGRARAAATADPAHVRPLLAQAAPLVERRLRFEVSERMAADGTVVTPLDEEEVRMLAARLQELASTPSQCASCTPTSTRSTSSGVGGSSRERAAAREGLALERDPARAARVRALGDDGRERLRAAADGVVHRPDPDRPGRDRARRRRSRSCSRRAA